MSFEEAWVLPRSAASYASEELLARVRAMLPAATEIAVEGDADDDRTIRVTFEETDAERVGASLARRSGQLDWDWKSDLDPPLFRDDGLYEVAIDVVQDAERPLVRVYSNDAENRAAWPLAFAIASTLAEDLGAVPEEDADGVPAKLLN